MAVKRIEETVELVESEPAVEKMSTSADAIDEMSDPLVRREPEGLMKRDSLLPICS